MKRQSLILTIPLIFCFVAICLKLTASGNVDISNKVIIVKTGIKDQQISDEWKAALRSRMSDVSLDSMGSIKRKLTTEEAEWRALIISKATAWNGYRDSLAVPFQNIYLPDTVYVMLGFLGVDDGFTFERQTVCLDLTALSNTYGKASLEENTSRINRIFAHEYTHLLHKEWARKTGYSANTFLDEILWECLYEGIGMYRSLNPRWLPSNDSLPAITRAALDELYPIFTERLITVKQSNQLSDDQKKRLQANLSRGNVNKKWGALPVAIWLLLEAKGDERRLAKWIDIGPLAVIALAKKYLPADNRDKLSSVF